MNIKNIRTLIVIPVINEKDNLMILIPKIIRVNPLFTILVIDDFSQDGTAEFMQDIINHNILYLRRFGIFGIGSAHTIGLKYALENRFELCITLDGDQTHDPAYLLRIIQKFYESNDDLILTSRFMRNGGLRDWSFVRRIITYLGHLLTFILIGSSDDLTSGMRGYKVNSIDMEMLTWLLNSDYEFFPLSYYYYKITSKKISQIPIVLPKRSLGSSKLTMKLLFKNIYSIFRVKYIYRKHLNLLDQKSNPSLN